MCIDFSVTGDGTPLVDGEYVKYEWFSAYGLTVSAVANDGSFTPDGKPRIFDTADPGTNNGNGDPDLGSPNEKCSPAGPGYGYGGRPGQPGENCVPQGNVLIIQEQDKADPDDDSEGGNITFTFDFPVEEVVSVGLMDIEEQGRDFIEILRNDGSDPVIFPILGLGDNSIQNETIREEFVKAVTISFIRSGAVRFICFCPSVSDADTSKPIISPTSIPVGVPPAPTRSPDTAANGGSAVDHGRVHCCASCDLCSRSNSDLHCQDHQHIGTNGCSDYQYSYHGHVR